MSPLWYLVPAVILINIPFGYWRQGVPKFSLVWFVAVHAPVPLVAALRIYSGLGWQLTTFPLLVAAYCVGQFLGGRLRRKTHPPVETHENPKGHQG